MPMTADSTFTTLSLCHSKKRASTKQCDVRCWHKADFARCLSLCPLSGRGFNRSRQHLLILLDWEVSDGGECTDVVHAETAGRALGAMEERSMCGGHRPSA